MPIFTDQINRKVEIELLPKRIISLVPSQTELLYDLDLEQEVIGITKFCIHPESWHKSKTRIGGTKQLNVDIIHHLNPDLIIANKEENKKEDIEKLEKHYPVWVSDINTLEDAINMISKFGLITGKENKAKLIVQSIKREFEMFRSNNRHFRKRTCCYLIWQNPYMTIGCDTFIHSMLDEAGFTNIFADRHRYPEITIEEIRHLNPEFLLLSSEPFPFSEKHVLALQDLFPETKILLTDGEMFSWYGSRLLYAPAYFKELGYFT